MKHIFLNNIPGLLVLLFVCGCSSPIPQNDALPTFTPLGDLPGGEYFSEAFGVSDDGTVVIGQSKSARSDSETEAFKWTASGGIESLGALPGGSYRSQALGISANGSVIVGNAASGAGQTEAFRWTRNTGMIRIGDLPGGIFASGALDVSNDGALIVGWGTSEQGFEAALWRSADGPEPLGDLPGGDIRSSAALISADGTLIVGTGTSEAGSEVVQWSQDGRINVLGDLPGGDVAAEPFGMTPFGLTIVGQGHSSLGVEAFRWTSTDGMVPLGDLSSDSFRSIALDVSDDGSRVVGTSTTDRGEEAFLWEKDRGMRPLDSILLGLGVTTHSRWILRRATGISSDGTTIVGYGTNPDGNTESWIIRNLKSSAISGEESLADQSSTATVEESSASSEPPVTASDIATAGIQAEEKQISDMIEAWAKAWSDKNVDAYLSFYTTDFRPPFDMSRTSWEQDRRERLTRPRFIRVTVGDLEVELIDDTTARARFTQSYQSDTYNDRVRKTFQLKKLLGNWKIRRSSTQVIGERLQSLRRQSNAQRRVNTPVLQSQLASRSPPVRRTFVNLTELEIQVITNLVISWAQAWSVQDADTYLSCYATDFLVPDNLSREAWEQNRRERLTRPRFIRVTLVALDVELIDETTARAHLIQSYQSDTFKSIIRKTLLLQKQNTEWKIVQERNI